MAKAKKISYKNIAAKLAPIESTTITLRGKVFDEAEVTIKHRLTMSELTELMSDIVNTVVDYKKGEYDPEYMDLVEMAFIIEHYAGISLGKSELSHAYRVLTETDLFDQIVEHIDAAQLAELECMVDDRIQYMRDMIVATASHKVVEMLAQMEQMTSVMGELNSGKVEELMASLNTLTGLVDPAHVQTGMLTAVGEVPVQEVELA